jgi:hypothetical protein
LNIQNSKNNLFTSLKVISMPPLSEDSKTSTLVILVVIVMFLSVLMFAKGGNCGCTNESYSHSKKASFPVKHPVKSNHEVIQPVKSNHMVNHPVKSIENFILPPPPVSAIVKSAQVSGGTATPTSNPWIGGLQGELSQGTSVASPNNAFTMAGNGAGNSSAMDVWKTVI